MTRLQQHVLKQAPENLLDAVVAMSGDFGDQAEGSAGILRHTELSPSAWMAGWFVGNELRGVIRASHAAGAVFVEANLFVDQIWQRQGIGSTLLKAAMDWTRRREAGTLRVVCDRAEWPMRHFANKFGGRLDLVLGYMVVDFPTGAQQ